MADVALPVVPSPQADAGRGRRLATAKRLSLTPEAGVVALTLLFVAISAWWLARDLRMVNLDNAKHLLLAAEWEKAFRSGDFPQSLTSYAIYPPGLHIVGGLAAAAFGVSVFTIVLAENVVFVPLLALGCYGTARIVYGRRAGVLAALFALATPIVMALFHMFLPDAPMTAMVAVTVWLLLASERFSRVGIAAIAGVVAGLGMYTKGTFVLFVIGVAAALFLRGGWRNWKGWLAFGLPAIAIAGPWFLDHYTALESQTSGHLTSPLAIWYGSVPYPSRTSVANYTWYFWNLVNNQLLLPLALFFFVGLGCALRRLARRPAWTADSYLPELLAGGVVGYIAVSLLVLKDPRYTLPCLVYVAVLATGWIVQLPRTRRLVATGLLVFVALFNTVTHNLGIGGVHSIETPLAVASPIGEYSFKVVNDVGYFGAEPVREAQPIIDLMAGLRRQGVTNAVFEEASFSQQGGYHLGGLVLLGIRGKIGMPGFGPEFVRGRTEAWIIRRPIEAVGRPPCLASPLADDGSGIYVYRGRVPVDPSRARPDCP